MKENDKRKLSAPAYLQNNLVSVESKLKNCIYSESQKGETALKYHHESVPSSPPLRFGTAGFTMSGASWENTSHQQLSLLSKW